MNFVKFLKTSFTRIASGRLPLYILLEALHTEALHNVRLLGFKTHKILPSFALRIHDSISPDVLLYITDNIQDVLYSKSTIRRMDSPMSKILSHLQKISAFQELILNILRLIKTLEL